MADPVLLTIIEAAQTLRCSPRQVWRLMASGKITAGPKYGKESVVTAESVYAACEVEAPAEAPPKRYRNRKQTRAEFDAEIDAL